MKIDDSSWQEDHILIVETHKDGEFKVLIQDSIGREIIVPFGSTFEVEMEETDSTYFVKILGEAESFHVELFNTSTLHKQDFITHEDHIVFPKATLLDNGFSGEYVVRVGYGNNRNAKELAQTIFLKKQESYGPKIVKALIFLLVIVGIFLLLLFSRKKQKEAMIFHQ